MRLARQPRILIVRSNPIAPDPRVEKSHASGSGRLCGGRAGLGPHRPAARRGEKAMVFRLPIQAEYVWPTCPILRWQWGLLALRRNHSRYAAIHACDFDTVLPAWWVSRRGRQKLVYDIFDFYADHLRPRRVDQEDHPPGGLFRHRPADALILVDDARRAGMVLARAGWRSSTTARKMSARLPAGAFPGGVRPTSACCRWSAACSRC